MQQVEQQIDRMTSERFNILDAHMERMTAEIGELRQGTIGAVGNIES